MLDKEVGRERVKRAKERYCVIETIKLREYEHVLKTERQGDKDIHRVCVIDAKKERVYEYV